MHGRIIVVSTLVLVGGCAVGLASTEADGWQRLFPPSDSGVAETDTLTLDAALARVRPRNLVLQTLAHRALAAQSATAQSRRRPNPTLDFEAENVDGDYSAWSESELSLWLSQEFELGGKRDARTTLASREGDATALAIELDALDVYLETKRRYFVVIHADEAVRLAGDAARIASDVARTADERVRAGAALVADRALGVVASGRARIAQEEAEVTRRRARRSLASMWGDVDGFDSPVSLHSLDLQVSPAPDSISAWIDASPEVARRRVAAGVLNATRDVSRSFRIPSLTADVGVRRVEADDATTWLFGFSLPLPVFDRHVDATQAAEAGLRAAQVDVDRARLDVRRDCRDQIEILSYLSTRLKTIEESLLPAQQSAFESLDAAYRLGGVSYSVLLDGARGFIDLQVERNDVRLAIGAALIDFERLLGRPIAIGITE